MILSIPVIRYLGDGRKLDPTLREKIRVDLATGMPAYQVDHYLTTKATILTESGHIAVAVLHGRHAGLIAASDLVVSGRAVTYIETLLVAEEQHGTALSVQLVSSLFGGVVAGLGGFPELVAMKTYTPKAYVLMRRFAPEGNTAGVEFYPDVGRAVQDEHLTRTAALLAAGLSPGHAFRPGSGVVSGGGGQIGSTFWREPPRCGDERVDRFFRTEVGERDRVLCLVRAPTPAARGLLCDMLRIERPTAVGGHADLSATRRIHG